MIDAAHIIVYHTLSSRTGPVAEWLCSGLQNRVHRFNSGPGLQRIDTPLSALSAQASSISSLSGLSILLV